MVDLFDYVYPDAPGFKARETSAKAADEMAAQAPRLRALALAALTASEGLTADEIAARIGMSILSIRPRISELGALNKVHDSGDRRKNASGKGAIVWKVGPPPA